MGKALPQAKPSVKKQGNAKAQRESASSRGKARQSAQSVVEERGRKKQLLKRRRYASVVGSILFITIIWAGISNRVDQRISDWLHGIWLNTSASLGFQFRELIVEGRRLTDAQEIVSAVGLGVGDSLFLVSLDEIRLRLTALDTVKDAHVTRDFSGRIVVTLVERVPFALWQHHDHLKVVDDAGVVLSREKPEDYPYLVTMVGDKAAEHMDNLVSFLAADKTLAKEIVAAVFVSDRRWDIHFANGVKILLPEMNPKAAWAKLAEMNREHDILKQSVQVIDLRIDDRVFITLPEEQAPKGDAPESDA
jgi:cell division protein FtsQ